ncbi:uncharacterized protein LOC144656767 isoform X1 [Oculina patagonica]
MKISLVTLLIGFLFCSFSDSRQAHLREKRNAQEPASEITVTLKIDWNTSVVNKPVPASYITKVQNGTLLADILNKAAGDNKKGPFNKYDSTYYGGLGYMITAMNGTEQNPATSNYWMLFDEETGGALPCGVSQYVPRNQSTTIFRYTASSSHDYNATGYCKQFPSSGQVPPSAITVTIELDWNVTSVGKPIPAPFITKVSNGTVLVDVMNKAANEEKNGPFNKYTSTYYGGLGHFITSMNGTKQDPQTNTYWMIYDKATGKLTPLGVSSYKPLDGSTTIFRLVPGASHESSTAAASKTKSPTEEEKEPNSAGKFVGIRLVILCFLAGVEALLFL